MDEQPGGPVPPTSVKRGHQSSPELQAPGQDQRLLAVFELARILVSEDDQQTLLTQFLSGLISRLEAADAGSLWLYDAASDRLVAASAQGYDLASLRQMRLAPGEAIAGKVFQRGESILCSTPGETADVMADLTDANRQFFVQATAGLGEALSALGVPLLTVGSTIGVLVFLNLQQPSGFTNGDLFFLERVADLLSLSIENARLREELRGSEALGEANRLKAELISTLAHEMRTPLTSIKGYSTALLMEEAAFSPETQREFLQIIDEECDTLQHLIRDILESSVIDAGLLKLEMQPVLLARLIQEVVDDMARRAVGCRFVVDLADRLPVVEADPERITQVLRNLLDNAVKYSPGGGLIMVRAESRPEEVVVSVADQGVGIAPEHLHQLFEKFFRAKTGLIQHIVGSGLGLPISHAIVESHGGRIWAESVSGQGSTFYFTLPVPGPDHGSDEGGAE
ncbi:MAG: ATP-binding protein [Anaerolineae bacterium]|nr:ATP-binding protein [Anaerolineae bacterium]